MNILKRIELQGFKSFAGKTILEIPAKIVAIVGPNGSGKSNVIDALKWVLGEREAKQLRGDTLDKLIFAGTPKKAAVGFAKVSLCFNNKSGVFPIEASEVVLSRKVDRSGISEFYLNDENIRLKDLVPILARAKLGSRGLMMIGQGQSDIFVKSSPEERRMMIEEILGLKEFRIKKTQAERRLASSEINIDKVKAMLDEITPHLRFLRKQKNRFAKRSELEEELKNLEDWYYKSEHRAFSDKVKNLNIPISELLNKKDKLEKDVAEFDKKIKELDQGKTGFENIKTLREKNESLFKEKSLLDRELARIDAKIEFEKKIKDGQQKEAGVLMEKLRFIEKNIERILKSENLDLIKKELLNIKNNLKLFFSSEGKDINSEEIKKRDDIFSEIKKIEDELILLKEREEKTMKEEEEKSREFRFRIKELEDEKNKLRLVEREIQDKLFESEKLKFRINEIEREWKSLGRAENELFSGIVVDMEIDRLIAERKMLKIRGELAAIGEIDEGLVKEANETETRHEFLSRELLDLESACVDLKRLINDLDIQIHNDFKNAFKHINNEFNNYFRLMFAGGKAHLKIERKKIINEEKEKTEEVDINKDVSKTEKTIKRLEEEKETSFGIEVELGVPKKKITSLEMLSGGEKSLVSIAALFALIAVSPPPFLVLDEVDAPLDDTNAKRFADLLKEFSSKTQFIIVTHNRATMESADVLYGVTMADDGVSKLLSMKMES